VRFLIKETQIKIKNKTMIRISTISIALLSLALLGCSNGNDSKITADIVKNPISASGTDKSVKMPEITFYSNNSDNPQFHDFGVVIQGELVVHTFTFKNTGSEDLIIRDINSTCGCTVPTYTKKPVAPGETGKIEVSFSSSGRKGRQHKSITVLTNSQPASVKLDIEANVVVPN